VDLEMVQVVAVALVVLAVLGQVRLAALAA
jgi:hypothetical protein